MNSYRDFVATTAKLFRQGKSISPKVLPRPRKKPAANAPVALIFSPHPDDECITGGLPLRLLQESGMRVINIAITLGSQAKRRSARLRELKCACAALGFELEQTAPQGLEHINTESRKKNPKAWATAVKIIAAILEDYQPRMIFFPHDDDHHPTHIGTHHLVMDALKVLPKSFTCTLVETEFWGQMRTPNLLVESSLADVGTLVNALALHKGEVQRNPYHLRLPAWMQDNVRRGAELIGGKGGRAPEYLFGTLYRARRWNRGHVHTTAKSGKFLSIAESAGVLLNVL
jgi:LmbE family N-acetylglucosaminyl deacetylase